MLSSLRRKKGQGVTGEYVVLIGLVSVAITAMTVYVRRTLQGRIGDADYYAVHGAATAIGVNILREYEPYYKRQTTDTDADKLSREFTVTGGSAVTSVNQNSVKSSSDQISPLQE